jgi:hypothetical protein
MLQKVWDTWIKGLLEQSLYSVARLELGLARQADTVDGVWDILVQRPDRPLRQLPPGTRISAVFQEFDNALLILGAPGSGKTTLLLELAKDLLDRAEKDINYPLPIVFNLSSWGLKQLPLSDWLVDELSKRYQVPNIHAQSWIDGDLIVPLLDGLDEVAKEHRYSCVEAINNFRKAHGLVPLAVCSRVADYEVLSTKLEFRGAIVVQPLSRDQTTLYLTQAGTPLAGVRAALRDDEALWELLDTPLMLSVVALAYKGCSAAEIQYAGTLAERKDRLFATYIDAMFKRRGKTLLYSPQLTIKWLSWLAFAMTRHNQSVFYLEWMQPDWLTSKWQQRITRLEVIVLSGLVGGLVCAILSGLVGGSVGSGLVDLKEPLKGLTSSFVSSMMGGLYGLIFGILFGLGRVFWWHDDGGIPAVEAVRWSWPNALVNWGSRLWVGMLLGYCFGKLLIDFWIPDAGGIIGSLLGGLINVLRGALVPSDITARLVPNEGIRRSFGNAFLLGLSSWLFTGLFCGLAVELFTGSTRGLLIGLLIGGGLIGPIVGLFIGLLHGGFACFQHIGVRSLLLYNGSTPWRFVHFLNFAADRVFLHKVGGGYIYIHRMMLDYFAALHTRRK